MGFNTFLIVTTTVFLSIITFVQLYLAYVSRVYEMFPKYIEYVYTTTLIRFNNNRSYNSNQSQLFHSSEE